jgi:hypothetical protein
MPKGFNLRCGAGKTARVWLQGKGGALTPGNAFVLLPIKERETEESPAGYYTSLRQALVDENTGHVNLIVCDADYDALKRGIEHLPAAVH